MDAEVFFSWLAKGMMVAGAVTMYFRLRSSVRNASSKTEEDIRMDERWRVNVERDIRELQGRKD